VVDRCAVDIRRGWDHGGIAAWAVSRGRRNTALV
jgi:hypothetical protein